MATTDPTLEQVKNVPQEPTVQQQEEPKEPIVMTNSNQVQNQDVLTLSQNIPSTGGDISGNNQDTPSETMNPVSDVNAGTETPTMADTQAAASETTTASATGEEPFDPFKYQQDLAKTALEGTKELAQSETAAMEASRRRDLERTLSQSNAGDRLAAQGKQLRDLSMSELEQLAADSGLDLSDDVKDRLKAGGLAAIEELENSRIRSRSEFKSAEEQLAREKGEALDEREKFNTQQDVKLRRLMNTFGGGVVQDLGTNVEVMRKQNEGQKILENLRAQYSGQQSQLSAQAQQVEQQYSKAIADYQNQNAAVLEDAYNNLLGTVDDLLDQGVTNKTTLNRAMFEAKMNYMQTYGQIKSEEANFIAQQNAALIEQQQKLAEQQWNEDKFYTEQTGMLYRNGQVITDSNGVPIQTTAASDQDNEMSRITGMLFRNGQPVIGPDGQPVYTLEADKFKWDKIMDRANFEQGVDEFNATHDLNFSEAQFEMAKYYAENGATLAQRSEFEGLYSGQSLASTEFANPNFPTDISTSKYNPTISEGGITLDTPLQDKGGGKVQLVSKRRQCGEYVNDVFGFTEDGGKIFGDSLESKTKWVTTNTPTPGSAFVMDLGTSYGHVGVVEKVLSDGSILISESNYDDEESFRRGWTTLDKLQERGLVGFTDSMVSYPQGAQPGKMTKAEEVVDALMQSGGYIGLSDLVENKDERLEVVKGINEMKTAAKQSGDLKGYIKTTVLGNDLDQAQFQGLEAIGTAVDDVNTLEVKLQDTFTGPIYGATIGAIPWNVAAQEVNALIVGSVPNLARGVFGEVGVLTDNDIKRYAALLPQLSTPGEAKAALIEIMRSKLRRSAIGKLETLAAGGKNVSEFTGLLDKVGYMNREETKQFGQEVKQNIRTTYGGYMSPFINQPQGVDMTINTPTEDTYQSINFFE